MAPHEPTAAPSIRALLGRLPEFSPPDQVWTRIVATRRQRQRRRRLLGGAAVAIAASLVAVAVLPLHNPAPMDGEIALWQARSETLEKQWRSEPVGIRGDAHLRAQLRLIDGELQAAYDRNAGSVELAALWKTRSNTLNDLISRGPSAVALTRL